jgi:hypothetical protein
VSKFIARAWLTLVGVGIAFGVGAALVARPEGLFFIAAGAALLLTIWAIDKA